VYGSEKAFTRLKFKGFAVQKYPARAKLFWH